jgi:uncharacterized protein (TIGR02145 family)
MINGDTDMTDNGIIEKYCYDNDSTNCDKYGGLYQWDEMMNYSTAEASRGICPEGWHIPVEDDLFGLIADFDAAGCRERGHKHWISASGTNTKGFTAVAAGYLQLDRQFYQQKELAVFNSSTTLPYNWIWHIEIHYLNHIIYGSTKKSVGNSLRCIKDE